MLPIPLLNVFFDFDLSSLAIEMNPWMCFCEQVGLQAHGTSRRMVFFSVVSDETVTF